MTTARSTLPSGLPERILAAARQGRAAGAALPAVRAISPDEAFARAADAFHSLLSALPDDAWRLAVLRDLDVQGLVGHLIGVERHVRRALTGDADVARADHVASTQPAAEREAGRSPEVTRAAWRTAADATLAEVRGADLDVVVAMHGMRLPLGSLLVVRAFELWTHENDIRAVAGLPAGVPDAASLQLMTDLAVRLLPLGVAHVDRDGTPVDVHLVLTGAGGGTWDVVLGDRSTPADAPEVVLVADSVRFCRVVAARLGPDELGAHVSGSIPHAATVLAGAAALALD